MESSAVSGSVDTICGFYAKKYQANNRLFIALRRITGPDDDALLYRGSLISSCSTRSSLVTDSASSRLPFFDALLRQIPWRHYRTSRTGDESEVSSSSCMPSTSTTASTVTASGDGTRYELVCCKSRDELDQNCPLRWAMDLRELLYISDFKQRSESGPNQYCVSLCGERFGSTFYFEEEGEWTSFLDHVRQVHMKVAKPIVHRIEYGCNVVIRPKGLAKPGPSDSKLQSVEPGSYRLFLLDSKLVFVRESVEQPALTLYYQWIRQMVRQQKHTVLRKEKCQFGLELGHMAYTGEGFVFFKVLDEPSYVDGSQTANSSGLPRSPLSDMLQIYMKDNSLVRQVRRTQRSHKSRQSSSSMRYSSSSSRHSTWTPSCTSEMSVSQTMDTFSDDFQLSQSDSGSKATLEQNSGPSTDETSTPTMTKPPSLSETESVSSSATTGSRYLTLDVNDPSLLPSSGAVRSSGCRRFADSAFPDLEMVETVAGFMPSTSNISCATPRSQDCALDPKLTFERYAHRYPSRLPACGLSSSMMGMFISGIADNDRTQRANSVGSKPVSKPAPGPAPPMWRCNSDCLGEPSTSRQIRWEMSNTHQPGFEQAAAQLFLGDASLVPGGDDARPKEELYVDYLPSSEHAGAKEGAAGVQPLRFDVGAMPMVAPRSLVDGGTSSTRSQLNSCSTSSSAMQLPDGGVAMDDYGPISLPADPTWSRD